MMLLLISLIIALIISVFATWLDWRVNPSGLFYSDSDIHWAVVWETLSSWLWALWLVFMGLGYVEMVFYRLIKG